MEGITNPIALTIVQGIVAGAAIAIIISAVVLLFRGDIAKFKVQDKDLTDNPYKKK